MHMDNVKISRVLFELSNVNRIRILESLQEGEMTLRDFSLKTGIPKPELSRNLKRLVSSGIIIRKGTNEYTLSPLGRILMLHLKNLNFLEKFAFIFMEHDLSFLPMEFQLTLGDLENIKVVEGTIEGFNLTVDRLNVAESYENIMTREILLPFIEPVKRLLEKNLKVKLIAPRNTGSEIMKLLEGVKGKNIRIKLVEDVKMVILADANTAEFNLPLLKGDLDYGITFYSDEERGVGWINRLFYYYWESLPGEMIL
ncbi:MAG TPA: ArsR family transcriptional regulator [Euryarchaeota archaeon]|nr:ArsR family transcriptional regulator [Thermoplasmatales archaeon]HEU12556.1 ArsR family transcriptional regulator [Euryarchaeota archaeon]